MSALQVGLIIAGVLFVAAVWIYNLLQERRARKRMDEVFGAGSAAAKGGGGAEAPAPVRESARIEPTFGSSRPAEGPDETATQAAAAGPGAEAGEHVDAPSGGAGAPAAPGANLGATRVAPAAAGQDGGPDAEIECVASLQAAAPVAGAAVLEAIGGEVLQGVRWLGRARNGAWQAVGAGAGEWYSELAACALLADRDGPIAESDLRAFQALVAEVAPKLPAAFRVPPLAEELARATELDRICAEVDIQIGLTLVRSDGAPIPGTRLRGVGEAAGFRLNGAGQFDFVSEESGQLLFRMTNLEPQPFLADTMRSLSTSGVTLVLDVPVVADAPRAFDQMRALAKRLAVTLEATLVDDNRRPLSDAALGKIRSSIQQAHAQMRAGGIEPGSARALRLFA